MRKAPRCQVCHQNEAIWAMQYVGEDTPTFSTLGSHYRGFRVTKVCDGCREHITTHGHQPTTETGLPARYWSARLQGYVTVPED